MIEFKEKCVYKQLKCFNTSLRYCSSLWLSHLYTSSYLKNFTYLFKLLSSERNDWSKKRQELLEQIKSLEKQLQDSQNKADSKSL